MTDLKYLSTSEAISLFPSHDMDTLTKQFFALQKVIENQRHQMAVERMLNHQMLVDEREKLTSKIKELTGED